MKLKRSFYIAAIIIILVIGVLSVPAIADAGSFSGNSDYGGGGGGWSGGSDWGGSSSGGWSSTYVVSNGSGGSPVAIIVAVVVIFIVLASVRKAKNGASFSGGQVMTSTVPIMPIEALRESDPFFSEADIQEKIANLYVQMQHAWQEKDFESMRPYMTDALYNQFSMQLNELIRNNATNYVERISVMSVMLNGWRQDEQNDIITALINTRITDYTLDDKTGKLLSGSKTAEKFMCYEWTLIRSIGMKTPPPSEEGKESTESIHCPSCGAPLDINQSAKCPYCDSVITLSDYDWVISSIKGISQRTSN